MKDNGIYSSQVLSRSISILSAFTHENPKLRFSDLLDRTGLNKSTLYRLLEDLRQHRLIVHDEASGTYCLGLRLFEMGTVASSSPDLRSCSLPVLEKLVHQTGETAHLCVLDGVDVVYIEKVDCSQPIQIPSWIGRRNPAYCTGVGKAILAYLAEDELKSAISAMSFETYTPYTITNKASLLRELRIVRKRQYALDQQERTQGIRCIASPIRNFTGYAIGGISIAGPTLRITKQKLSELAAKVRSAGLEISSQFGFREPEVK